MNCCSVRANDFTHIQYTMSDYVLFIVDSHVTNIVFLKVKMKNKTNIYRANLANSMSFPCFTEK